VDFVIRFDFVDIILNFGRELLDKLRDFQFLKKELSPLRLSFSQSDSDHMASRRDTANRFVCGCSYFFELNHTFQINHIGKV
jgi:hypothetical protein